MGTVSALLPQSKYIMKFLLVVVLLAYTRAEAEPEADADPLLLYGTYGALAHLPTVSVKTTPAEVKTVVNPVTYTLPAYTYGLGYPYTYGHLGYPYTYGLGYPYTYGYGWPYLGLVPTVAAEAAE